MNLLGGLLIGFFVFAVGYDLFHRDYRNAAIVGVVLAVSIVAGVLGARA